MVGATGQYVVFQPQGDVVIRYLSEINSGDSALTHGPPDCFDWVATSKHKLSRYRLGLRLGQTEALVFCFFFTTSAVS